MEVSEFVIVSNNTSFNTSSSSSSNNNNDSLEIGDIPNHSEKIYLDYNATTPLEKDVVEAINKSLEHDWSNPSSQYKEGKEAKMAINKARSSIAQMINAKSTQDIVFVSGGTEANNIVFYSMLKYYERCKKKQKSCEESLNYKSMPHIIISEIEHDSVKLIAENYEKDNLAEITYIRVNEHGLVNVDEIIGSIKPNTVLISIMLANNETGVIQPVGELTNRLKNLPTDLTRICPIYVHTDAAQAIGKIAVDVDELGVDYLTIVGHKFYAPRIGALFARNCQQQVAVVDNDKKMAPLYHMFYGAGQENGLRPGTENTPMIVGLGKAAE